MSVMNWIFEALRSEICTSHIAPGPNIGLKHWQKSYVKVKNDYRQSGAFQVLTSGETPGSPLGKTPGPLLDLWGTPGKNHGYAHKT